MDLKWNTDREDEASQNGGFLSVMLTLSRWNKCHKSLIGRLLFVIIVMSFFFLSIGYKIVYTALSNSSEGNIFAKNTSFRQEISDRNGHLLAINLPAASLYANPKKILDPEDAAEKLVQVIPALNQEKLLQDFKSKKSFVWVKRDLTDKEKHDIHHLGIPGVYFEKEEKRTYTHGNLFSHLIGYVSRDNEGQAGLEKSYDKFLKEKGESLKLTVDVRLQAILNEELDKTIKHFKAQGAAAMIIDPSNGEVLACMSKPDFNPHFPGKATDEELFNSYGTGVYELGSIIKVITVAMGLDTKRVALSDAYDITTMRVANFNVKDWHKKQGWHSVPQIFLSSSNVGMAQMILEVGKEDYKKYLDKFGLLKRVDVEIPERAKPIVMDEKRWTDLGMVTMSYGYSLSMTPLHFANAMIPAVNGGIKHPLHFVKRDKRPEGERILDEQTSKDLQKLLHLTAQKGTARKSNVKGYFVGGKTGTANKLIGSKYAENSARISSLLTIFPSHDPKYMIFIMLDNPQPTKETFGYASAGWTIAPMVKNIITRMVALYGISPYDDLDGKIKDELYVDYEINAEI